MSNIALNLYVDKSIKEIKYNLQIINERLLQQSQQIQQIFEYNETTTTKAELHTVMALLTYKNNNIQLTNSNIIEIISNKFKINEEINKSDFNSYLHNPFEAIGSLGNQKDFSLILLFF